MVPPRLAFPRLKTKYPPVPLSVGSGEYNATVRRAAPRQLGQGVSQHHGPEGATCITGDYSRVTQGTFHSTIGKDTTGGQCPLKGAGSLAVFVGDDLADTGTSIIKFGKCLMKCSSQPLSRRG